MIFLEKEKEKESWLNIKLINKKKGVGGFYLFVLFDIYKLGIIQNLLAIIIISKGNII